MDDIGWIIGEIDPDVIIPVHTEARDWFEKNFEKVVLIDEGVPLKF